MASNGLPGWPAVRALSQRLRGGGPSPAIIEGLRRGGPDAVVALGPNQVTSTPVEMVEEMLGDAASFPLGWLLAAERHRANMHSVPPLADVAKEQSWFTDG